MHDEVIYPVFIECCQYTTDAFWETIFMKLAMGIPPHCSTMTTKCICTANSQFKFADKDAMTIYTELHRVFSANLDERTEFTKCNSRDSWSTIRKKSTKDLLFEMFVLQMKKEYELTTHQSRHLLSFIMLAVVLKTINAEDIVYENQQIVRIESISFERNKIIFSNDLEKMIDVTSNEQKQSLSFMHTNWERYVGVLIKKLN
jgi:hypothetical protein